MILILHNINKFFKIISLNNGTKYNIKIKSINDSGIEEYSNEVNVTPMTVPYEPTNLLFYDYKLIWNKPYDGGSPIIYYEVLLFDSSDNEILNTNIYSTSELINYENPPNCQYYKISAVNKVGKSYYAKKSRNYVEDLITSYSDYLNFFYFIDSSDKIVLRYFYNKNIDYQSSYKIHKYHIYINSFNSTPITRYTNTSYYYTNISYYSNITIFIIQAISDTGIIIATSALDVIKDYLIDDTDGTSSSLPIIYRPDILDNL